MFFKFTLCKGKFSTVQLLNSEQQWLWFYCWAWQFLWRCHNDECPVSLSGRAWHQLCLRWVFSWGPVSEWSLCIKIIHLFTNTKGTLILCNTIGWWLSHYIIKALQKLNIYIIIIIIIKYGAIKWLATCPRLLRSDWSQIETRYSPFARQESCLYSTVLIVSDIGT